MADFGAGPLLTEDLDFEVTTTGDIAVNEGVRELEKDIALQNLINLQNITGTRATPQNRAKIRSRVRGIILADPRVSSVQSVTINFIQQDDAVEIITEVIADGSEQELVFEV
jgi:hypothetical protein